MGRSFGHTSSPMRRVAERHGSIPDLVVEEARELVIEDADPLADRAFSKRRTVRREQCHCERIR